MVNLKGIEVHILLKDHMCDGSQPWSDFPDLHSFLKLHKLHQFFTAGRRYQKVLSELFGHGKALFGEDPFDFFRAVVVEIPHALMIIHLLKKDK